MEFRNLLPIFSKTVRNLTASSHCQRKYVLQPNRISHVSKYSPIHRQTRQFTYTNPSLADAPGSNTTKSEEFIDNTLDSFLKKSENAKPVGAYRKNASRLKPLQQISRVGDVDLTLPLRDDLINIRDFNDVIPPLPAGHNRPPELGPNVGRSVLVRNGDLTVAMNKLRRILVDNNVRVDMAHQKFYERSGMKRKRLKRERFRKRFKEGFKRMVGIVLDMKRQGI